MQKTCIVPTDSYRECNTGKSKNLLNYAENLHT